MKPIKLALTAFGSYKDRTVVDFEKLGNGVYLITGDTGAGKTTIFDGIMFALYGQTVNKQRVDAKDTTVHSNFADKSTPAVAELVFEEKGKRYTVKRTQAFSKSRQTSEYKPKSKEAELNSDSEAIIGDINVTERIEEIIGIDAEQFRSIVLLAQGEFTKFLSSNSREKEQILSTLFDNSRYERFQEALSLAYKKTEKQREEQKRAIEESVKQFTFPPFPVEMSEEMKNQKQAEYNADNPKLVEVLREITANDKKTLQEIEKELSQLDKEKEKLVRATETAKADNEAIKKREEAENKLNELKAKSDEYKHLEEAKKLFEKALAVNGVKKLLDETIFKISSTKKGIETSESRLSVLETEKTTAEADAEKAKKETERAANEIIPAIRKIEESLGSYDEISTLEKEISDFEADVEKSEKVITNLETENQKLESRNQEIQEKLESFGNIEAKLEGLKADSEKVQNESNRLVKIKTNIAEHRTTEKEKANALSALNNAQNTAVSENEKYNALFDRFIRGQAGLLANELRDEIIKNGRGICPVCKTEFCDSDHDFAKSSDTAVTDKELETAKLSKENAEKSQNDCLETYNTKKIKSESQEKALKENAESLGLAFEELIEGKALGKMIAECKAKNETINSEIVKNTANQKESKLITEEQHQNVNTIKENEKKIEENRAAVNEARQSISSKKGSLDEKKKALSYSSKAEAESEIGKLKSEADRISRDAEAKENKLTEISRNSENLVGQLVTLKQNLDNYNSEKQVKEKEFLEMLSKNGFAAEADFNLALELNGSTDSEIWLEQQRAEIDKYNDDVKSAVTTLEIAKQNSEGKELRDIQILEEKQAELTRIVSEKTVIKQEQFTKTENNKNALLRIENIFEEKRKQSRTYELIRRLSMAVEGSDSSDRIDFKRYVLSRNFREILNAANERLLTVSGGKYELEYEESAGTQRSTAGLEMKVMDYDTGEKRRTETLSGGESFYVSLSLALGLSDVVQSHSGGISIDTMFIDEGFGTLDNSRLDETIKVLENLADGKRQIGIISHVDKLESAISKQIIVRKYNSKDENKGSYIEQIIK